MSAKRTGLGRGLDALLGDVDMAPPAVPVSDSAAGNEPRKSPPADSRPDDDFS